MNNYWIFRVVRAVIGALLNVLASYLTALILGSFGDNRPERAPL